MTWLALEAEIAAEMRAHSEHERVETLAAMHAAVATEQFNADRLRRYGKRWRARMRDRALQKAATLAKAERLAREGDIRGLRALESRRRAAKRRWEK